MVHQRTGEVIHIDFGIVFEQGKVRIIHYPPLRHRPKRSYSQRLQTPECVPFRLTRNIVDGMGPLGTRGVFTTAAETTLEVLKENSNALLTILSAIVNDPLYKWTLGIGNNAQESKAGRNAAAALAISRIQEKLQGCEEGAHGEQQTVSSQVLLLVNEAKDPNNLCRMYFGWGPHC
jgi:serine-protein kinase ATM